MKQHLARLVALLVLALATGCAAGGITPAQSFVATHTACPPASYYRPRWSPDGSRIAYLFGKAIQQDGGHTDIYVMNADGSGNRRIYSDKNWAWSLAWWPDGKQIMFEYRSTAIDRVSVDGGPAVLFIKGGDRSVAAPVWSRDGRHLAFAHTIARDWDIFVGDASGMPDVIDLARWGTAADRFNDRRGDDQAPAWSPDGIRIAFASFRDQSFDLYTMRADGSGLTQLTDTQADEYHPTWSVDGGQIAYSVGYGLSARIMVINADGSDAAYFTDGYTPDWSPDGSRMAFVSERTGRAEIYTMRPDGGDVRQLTANPSAGMCLH